MKTIISFLFIFFLVPMSVPTDNTDVYVKGIQRFDARYHHGHLYPEYDLVHEWWFGKNKVSFLRSEFRNFEGFLAEPALRLTLDKDKQRIIVVNLTEKSFVEVHLPMNIHSHVDQSIVQGLNNYKISGTIKKTGEKKIIHQKECDVYSVNEWITRYGSRFYDKERTVMITTDVPFDWLMINELYEWDRAFFNPQESYLSELGIMKGFILESNDIRFSSGGKIKSRFKILEISSKKAPENIFGIPKGFKKKEKFAMGDLFGMIGAIYVFGW